MQLTERLCLECLAPVVGRSDKKFCDDYCRNNFNNLLKRESNNFMRNINNTLRKNRKILSELLAENEETYRINFENLMKEGFLFKYHTHTYTNVKGDTYYYCYDYGYLPLDNDWFLIVKSKSTNHS